MKITDNRIRDIIKQEIIKKESHLSEQSANPTVASWQAAQAQRDERFVDVQGGEDLEGRRARRRGGSSRRGSTGKIAELQEALGIQITGEYDDHTIETLVASISRGYKTYNVSGMPSLNQIIGDEGEEGAAAEWSPDRPYAANALGYGLALKKSPTTAMISFIRSGYAPNPEGAPELFSLWLREKLATTLQIVAGDSSFLADPESEVLWGVYVENDPANRADSGKRIGELTLDKEKTDAWTTLTGLTAEDLSGTASTLAPQSLSSLGESTERMSVRINNSIRQIKEQGRSHIEPAGGTGTIGGTGGGSGGASGGAISSAQQSLSAAQAGGGAGASGAGLRPAYLVFNWVSGDAFDPWDSPAADKFAVDIGYTGAVGSVATKAAQIEKVKADADKIVDSSIAAIAAVDAKYTPLVSFFDSMIDGITSKHDVIEMLRKTLGLIDEDNEVLANCRLVNGLYAHESWGWGDITVGTAVAVLGIAALAGLALAGPEIGGLLVAAEVGVLALGAPAAVGTAATVATAGVAAGGTMWGADWFMGHLIKKGGTREMKILGSSTHDELARDIKNTWFPNSAVGRAVADVLSDFWQALADDQDNLVKGWWNASMTGMTPQFTKTKAKALLSNGIKSRIGGNITVSPCAPNGMPCGPGGMAPAVAAEEAEEVVSESTRKKMLRSMVRTAMVEGLIDDDVRGGEGSEEIRQAAPSVDTRGRGATSRSDMAQHGGSWVEEVEGMMGLPSPDSDWDDTTWRRWGSFTRDRMAQTGISPEYADAIAVNWQGYGDGIPGHKAAGNWAPIGRGYSPDARGAKRFLDDLLGVTGETGSRQVSGGVPGGMRYVADAAGADEEAVSGRQLRQIGDQVAAVAKSSGEVNIFVSGAGNIKVRAAPGTVPLVDRPGLRKRLRRLNLGSGSQIAITLTDTSAR